MVGAVAALLMSAGLVTAAPASAGCLYGGPFISKCDAPVQPNGTWQRCVGIATVVPGGFGTHLAPVKRCELMGPGQPAWDFPFNDPPVHIAD